MLNIIFWVIFGVLSGWTVALIAQPKAELRRIAGSGAAGIIGGVFGGMVAQLLMHQPVVAGFNGPSILLAVLTAVVLASVCNFIFKGHVKT